jgi:hypothetical protein
VTEELDKLAMKEPYHGGDQIYTASGSGMHIKHIGHSIVRTPHLDLNLNNILYVPNPLKILHLFTALQLTIMSSLNYILISFLLRIGSRAKPFFKASLKGACTFFLAIQPPLFLSSKFLVRIKYPIQGGMLA